LSVRLEAEELDEILRGKDSFSGYNTSDLVGDTGTGRHGSKVSGAVGFGVVRAGIHGVEGRWCPSVLRRCPRRDRGRRLLLWGRVATWQSGRLEADRAELLASAEHRRRLGRPNGQRGRRRGRGRGRGGARLI